jgi:hypothetical protein
MTLDAAPGPFREFELGECGEEANGGPPLLVGPSSDVLPEAADGRKPQLMQQQWQPRGVDGDRAHAESSMASLLSNAS